jgi:hypothetical protein
MYALIGLTRDRLDLPWRAIGVAVEDEDAPPGIHWLTSTHLEDVEASWGLAAAIETALRHELAWHEVVNRFAGSPANTYAELHSTFCFAAYQVPQRAMLADLAVHHLVLGRLDAFRGAVSA